ncbi:ATP-binding cassette domain-containing protein [Spiroplasma endosymbiont of Othius punctulatus]|uniref:ABC transporter ATP-binding protein/permease n=1 Tax=Spiroplasma endosymbiont of Othius punctulatus TaxID=3066289 RepID=UPI0030D00E45
MKKNRNAKFELGEQNNKNKTPGDDTYLFVDRLSKEFKNGSGVKEISFTINKGEIIGFIGDNGAGKTTTIKLIFGEFLKNEGDVTLENGSLLSKKNLRKIAFFPDQNNYPKSFNIVSFAEYSAKLKGYSHEEIYELMDTYLEALNLTDYKKNKFTELSAGMQKRALLLSVLITNPEIIILDEPTANLDVKSRLEFMNILRHLSDEYNKTIVITSHNIDELNNLINRVILVKKINNKGEVIYDAPFDKEKENLRDVYMSVIGSDGKNINFEKIKDLEKNRASQKNSDIPPVVAEQQQILDIKEENHFNNFKNSSINFYKGSVSFIKGMSIFQRSVKKIIVSKSFIITTSIFAFVYLLATSIFAFASSSGSYGDIWNTFATWVPFSILVIYVSFFEVYSISGLFNNEIKDGVIQLEIRSGISKPRIFLERVLANKVIVFSYLSVATIFYVIISAITPNTYTSASMMNVSVGMMFIFIIDILLSGILLLFANTSSSALSGSLGSIFGMLISISFLVNLLTFSTMNINMIRPNDNDQSSRDYDLNEYNFKYELMNRMYKVENKYGENSIIKENINDLQDLQFLFSDTPNMESGLFNQYDFINNNKDKKSTTDGYVYALLSNGLLTEAKDLSVYTVKNNEFSEIELEINNDVYENNSILKLMNTIKSYQKISFKFSDTVMNNSIFKMYYDFGSNKSEGTFKKSNGLYAMVDVIKESTNQKELREIADIVKDAAMYLFDKYFYQERASIIENSFIDEIESSAFDETSVWHYREGLGELNQELVKDVKINDGIRTFNKIYVDLLVSYINLKNTRYGHDPSMSAKEYNTKASVQSYLNPFAAIPRIFYESGRDNNVISMTNNTFWLTNTYEVESLDKQNFRDNFIQDPEFVNENVLGTPIYIKTNKQYFNNPIAEDESLDESDLRDEIVDQMKTKINPVDIEVMDSNKIEILNTGKGNYIKKELIIKDINADRFDSVVKIAVLFDEKKGETSNEFELRKKEIENSFNIKKYKKYSQYFNQFENGREFVSMKKLSLNFSPILDSFLFLLSSIGICAIGFYIFNKKIVK